MVNPTATTITAEIKPIIGPLIPISKGVFVGWEDSWIITAPKVPMPPRVGVIRKLPLWML